MTSLFSCNITPPESDPSANLSNLDEFFSNRFIHEAKATSIINTGLTLSDKTDKYENKCITIDANYNEELGKTSFGLDIINHKIISYSNLNTKYDNDIYNQTPNLTDTEKAQHNSLNLTFDDTKKVAKASFTVETDYVVEKDNVIANNIAKKYQELNLKIVRDSSISVEKRIEYITDNISIIHEHPTILFPLLESIIDGCPRYGKNFIESEKSFMEQQNKNCLNPFRPE